jgi:cation/acetate symporter
MSILAWTWIIVGLTFAMYIGIAIWSRARTTGDFYVASKQVHPVLNGMATGQTGCLLHHLFRWPG